MGMYFLKHNYALIESKIAMYYYISPYAHNINISVYVLMYFKILRIHMC